MDVVYSAHVHAYQRLKPLDPAGAVDPVNGIRTWVAGMGGAPLVGTMGAPTAITDVQQSTAWFGIVKFKLYDGGYDWEFIQAPTSPSNPAPKNAFADSGSGVCH